MSAPGKVILTRGQYPTLPHPSTHCPTIGPFSFPITPGIPLHAAAIAFKHRMHKDLWTSLRVGSCFHQYSTMRCRPLREHGLPARGSTPGIEKDMRILDQLDDDAPRHLECLSRLPGGRFLLTAAHGSARRGLLVERVQQCADEPPTILVSVQKGHTLSPLIRDAGTFGIIELGSSDRILSRLFSRPTALLDEDPFLGHQMIDSGMLNGPPVPACGASWMGCELLRHLDIEADCEIYIGRVIESGVASSTSGRIEPPIPAAELDVEGSAAGSTKNGRGRSKRATG